MPAPEVSSFGDEDHNEGETGLTIDGGGFGAFPGSAWMVQNADGSGLSDQLTVGTWNDIQLGGVAIPGSPNNAPGTVYLRVQREDLAWSNALSFILTAGGPFIVNLTGTLTLAGGLVRRTDKVMTGALTLAGVLTAVKVAIVMLTGVLTMAGVLTRRTDKVLIGSAASTGALLRMTSKLTGGALTMSGALSAVRAALVTLSGVLSMSGGLTRQVSMTSLSGQLTPTGELFKLTSKSVSGVLSLAGVVSSSIVGVIIPPVRIVIGFVKKIITGSSVNIKTGHE